ncbi:hypothetical protein WLZ34_06845 [Thermogladius sp. KZ2Tp1]|uniref:hypothetical protein n=1 Tax=Thermogladius sp. KZ2Tp1 TaxID=3136289 RepID=UPI003DA8CCFE
MKQLVEEGRDPAQDEQGDLHKGQGLVVAADLTLVVELGEKVEARLAEDHA